MVKIGSNSKSLRKSLAFHYKDHVISKDNYYITVDFPIDSLPDDLAAIVLKFQLPNILFQSISESTDTDFATLEFLTEAVISEITVNGRSDKFQKELSSEIRKLLLEGSVIHIEGMLYFRMKQKIAELFSDLQDSIRKYNKIYEKMHLLKLLRKHITERSPQTDFISVSGRGSDFSLYDTTGRRINCVFPENYTPEEHLLNSLLYLSPASLDISNLEQSEMKSVLSEIFSDRLV